MPQRPLLLPLPFLGRVLLPAALLLQTAACSPDASQKDPVAEAKFENERRISSEDVTKKQERDAEFMVNTAVASQLTVQLSQLAQQKAALPAVRALAGTLQKDHTTLDQALRELAQQKSIVLPTGLGADQQKRYREFGSYTGGSFDREYIGQLTDSYKQLAEAFDDMREDAYDGDIRGFAANYLPIVQQHLTQLKDLEDQTEDLK